MKTIADLTRAQWVSCGSDPEIIDVPQATRPQLFDHFAQPDQTASA